VGFTNAEVGNGFVFNGGTGYVQLPPNLFPLGNGGAFSIEFWFSTVSDGVMLAQQDHAPYTTLGGWVPMLYVGTDGFLYAQTLWGGSFNQLYSQSRVSDGFFHHVTLAYDGANQFLYIDGALAGSSALPFTTYASNFYCQLGVGYTQYWRQGNGGWFPFNGIIDEVHLYSAALSAAQDQAIYNAGSSGLCADLFQPIITQQPTNTTAIIGSTAVLSVGASSPTPLTYQWYEQGAAIPDGTNASLVFANVSMTNAGSYDVVVSNMSGSVTSAIVSLTVVNLSCVEPPPGLVGWWPGESNAADIIGGNNGIAQNGVSYGPGVVVNGFVFNGTTSYVQLLKNLFPTSPGAPFSLEMWFATSSGGVLIGQQSGQPFNTPNGSIPYLYVGTDGHLYTQLFWNGAFAQLSSSSAVNDGKFHHVAVTYDGANQNLFLDGAAIGSSGIAYSNYSFNFSCQLGTGYTQYWPAGNGGWFTFNGIIDEFSLYDAALTPAAVQSIYNVGHYGKCQDQIAPNITSQPVNQNVNVGDTAVFSVTVTSLAALHYQWLKNGLPLSGATSARLTLPDVQLSDSGNMFSCIVSNLAGVAVSTNAALAVNYMSYPEATVAFFSGSNGAYPFANVIQGSDGNFYGTTAAGGTNDDGTVFELSTNGVLTALVSFGGTNGQAPLSGLIQLANGVLYGTTSDGGTNGSGNSDGTVFEVTTNGLLTTLFTFNQTNGSAPQGSLYLGSDGTLHGTTASGPSLDNNSAATVFDLTTNGQLIASLPLALATAGDSIFGGLIPGNDGNLYGTAAIGGSGGFGTVFKVANASIVPLASFNGTNGSSPVGNLLLGMDGNFYGVTSGVGSTGTNYGEIFRVTPAGALSTLFNFGGSNGAAPLAGLIQTADGSLYGTTSAGGDFNLGTVFRLTTNGDFSTLLSFNGTNGSTPQASLIQASDGNLYGTTTYGGPGFNGTAQSGNGLVFRLQIPPYVNPNGPYTTNFALTAAYTADLAGPQGIRANNGGLTIGHDFTLTGTNLQVFALGVYNNGGGGLVAPHLVSIFTNNNGVFTQLPGASLTVPAGPNTLLTNGYRFAFLPAPITLTPGNYGIVAFNMNGFANGSDPYSDSDGSNNFFVGFPGFADAGGIADFNYNPTTGFPSPGAPVNFSSENTGSASFLYNAGPYAVEAVQTPVISAPYVFVNAGDTTSLSASAGGSPPIFYQWYYGPNQTPIPGATNATLVLSNIQMLHSLGNEGVYSVSAANLLTGPVFSDPAKSATVAILPSVAPLKIMPLGDSITAGVDSSGGGYRAPLFAQLINANFNVQFIGTQNSYPAAWLPQPNHEGHPGFRLDDLDFSFPYWWNDLSVKPDIVLLMAGINDFEQGYYLDQVTSRLDNLINLVCSKNPNVVLFVGNLIVTTNTVIEGQVDTLFNPFVPGIVANHVAQGQNVHFVDLHSAVSATNLDADGIHPLDAGYAQMAARWFQALTSVFPPPGSTNPAVTVNFNNTVLTYGMAPGAEFIIERATDLTSGVWVPISTNVVPSNGQLQVIDAYGDLGGVAPNEAFYKLILQ
jgi:uncharacterized repeat protein (TIGR03803 family)